MKGTAYLTYEQVEQRLGTSRVTLWRWVRDGRFPAPVRLGPNKVAFRVTDVRAWESERPSLTYRAAADAVAGTNERRTARSDARRTSDASITQFDAEVKHAYQGTAMLRNLQGQAHNQRRHRRSPGGGRRAEREGKGMTFGSKRVRNAIDSERFRDADWRYRAAAQICDLATALMDDALVEIRAARGAEGAHIDDCEGCGTPLFEGDRTYVWADGPRTCMASAPEEAGGGAGQPCYAPPGTPGRPDDPQEAAS